MLEHFCGIVNSGILIVEFLWNSSQNAPSCVFDKVLNVTLK